MAETGPGHRGTGIELPQVRLRLSHKGNNAKRLTRYLLSPHPLRPRMSDPLRDLLHSRKS